MQQIIWDFSDFEKLAEKLTAGASTAVDTFPAMFKITEDMLRIEGEIFGSQGRRGGGSWKALQPDTAKRKGDTKILMGTQDESLFKSLTIRGAQFQILNVDNTVIEFGTERPYAYVHQTGSAWHIPRRPFLKFLPTDIDRWSNMLLDHLIAPFKLKHAR